MKYRVGQHIEGNDGIKYAVGQVWEHDTHYDYLVFNTKTGEDSTFREPKDNYKPPRGRRPYNSIIIEQML